MDILLFLVIVAFAVALKQAWKRIAIERDYRMMLEGRLKKSEQELRDELAGMESLLRERQRRIDALEAELADLSVVQEAEKAIAELQKQLEAKRLSLREKELECAELARRLDVEKGLRQRAEKALADKEAAFEVERGELKALVEKEKNDKEAFIEALRIAEGELEAAAAELDEAQESLESLKVAAGERVDRHTKELQQKEILVAELYRLLEGEKAERLADSAVYEATIQELLGRLSEYEQLVTPPDGDGGPPPVVPSLEVAKSPEAPKGCPISYKQFRRLDEEA
jgi:hypothetical protein